MKKIILVVLLLVIAGIAGVVRSHTRISGHVWPLAMKVNTQTSGNVRDEIRKTVDLNAGARVEVSGINGWVKIETSDSKTADILIERFGESQEVLNRRKIVIDNNAAGLTIRGEKDDSGQQPTEGVHDFRVDDLVPRAEPVC